MMVRVFFAGGALLVLSGCAQFTTNATEQSALKSAAGKAGDDYVACVVKAAEPYQQTGESASLIIEVAKKACTAARSSFVAAETAALKTQYMSTGPILEKNLGALDQRAADQVQQVQERALEQKAVSGPVAAAAVVTPVASASAARASADSGAYLKCMSAEGQRYAGVNEPAQVVAEVAQSRCAALLTDPATAAQLEKQGRALVMGMVLDRKASGQ